MIEGLIIWLLFWVAVLAALAFGLRLAWRAVRAMEHRADRSAELTAMQLRLDQLETTVADQARALRHLEEGADFSSRLLGDRSDVQRRST